MTLKHVALAAVAALSLAAGQAHAVTFEGKNGDAANTVTDYSTGALLSFDIDFRSKASVILNFRIEAEDLIAPQLTFNSLVRNLTGQGFADASVHLSGISFAAPAGTVTTDGFVTAMKSSHAREVSVAFSPALTTEFYVGNPLAVAGAVDWALDLAGHQVGDHFSITVTVPEPEGYALMVAGLLTAGLAVRSRRHRG